MSSPLIDQSWLWSGGGTIEDKQRCCLQRIADATETMAKNHDELQRRAESFERMYKDQRRRAKSLERSNAALRGVITKLNNKIKQLEGEHD